MSKFNWAICDVCRGNGEVWPNGPHGAPEVCSYCRGVGRLCTAEGAELKFDPATGRPAGGISRDHPLGECRDCRGLINKVLDELNRKTLKTLDQADDLRNQRRGFEEAAIHMRMTHEDRLAELEGKFAKLEAGTAAKQLTGRKKKEKKVEP